MVSTNSGMDYWNGTLDWTTGLSYFPFLDRFTCILLEEALKLTSRWLQWTIVIMMMVAYCSDFSSA